MKLSFYRFFWLIFLIPLIHLAQTKISGKVTDSKGNALPGANIYIKDTYDGVTSKNDGSFTFRTKEKGDALIIAGFVGYKSFKKKIYLKGEEIKLDVVMEEEISELNAVVVSAGSFEASDEKKGVILKPMDVLTTGSSADLYSALTTLPGAQIIGEENGLFVRGGSASESKTIVDEMIIQKPFYSSVPDLPSRGRFSPMLFKGTVFSTGGYSAQYGQALSSALILKTQDLPAQTLTSFNLMVFGLGGAHVQRWENASIAVEGGYYNLTPFNKVFKQRTEWDKSPESVESSVNFRYKVSKNGILKASFTYSGSDLSMFMQNLDDPQNKDNYRLTSFNYFSNVTYKDIIDEEWTIFTGLSFSFDRDKIGVSSTSIRQDQVLGQSKITLSRKLFGASYLTFGAEIQNTDFNDNYFIHDVSSGANQYFTNLNEFYSAAFTETDIFFTNDFAAKIGLRAEHSKILDKLNLAPRISFAYRLGLYDQLNFAYGKFYQTPQKDYLTISKNFNYENASHYIFNYQYIRDNQTFRAEIYYKDYENLAKGTTYSYPYFTLPIVSFSNDGKGYARGLDIFWRDGSTFQYVDYWISYSYLDTKRNFSNYPKSAFPTFASPHTFSLVLKRWFESISSYVSLTYTHAEGRPYFNPNNPDFLADRTKSYNNLSGNVSIVSNLFGGMTVFFISVDNFLGFQNVYGYRYSSNGKRESTVLPPTDSSLFFGMFISLGQSIQQ